jgi:HSP20 family protein
MALHVIRVVRELADQGSRSTRQPLAFYCSEEDDARCSKWEPNTDIFECGDYVIIRMELSGVHRETVSVHVKNGRLEVKGVRRENRPDRPIYYHQLEINYGPFLKVVTIPEEIEHNDISAVLSDGLLEIKISKCSQVVEIPISVESKEPKS